MDSMMSADTAKSEGMLSGFTLAWPGQAVLTECVDYVVPSKPKDIDSEANAASDRISIEDLTTAPSKPKDIDSEANATSDRISIEDLTTAASGVCPTSLHMPSQRCFESDVYKLLASSAAHAESGILFAWWPRSNAWNLTQLVERTTRCLPAVRPGVDRVALPDILEAHELWESWSSLHGLGLNQAIWFPPLLEELSIADAAFATCRMVFKAMSAEEDPDVPNFVYPMYMTQDIQVEAAFYGIYVIGDAEDHTLMPLSTAKAWMHPQLTTGDAPVTSSLRALLPSSLGVRGPYGYVATTAEDLHAAWVRLQQECPQGARLVLKPASGSGGCGVILDATEADLNNFHFNSGGSAILEEMVIGSELVQSPTLYMIGDMPCGFLADQVLSKDGATNLGNKYPSNLRADLFPMCLAAARAVNKAWNLTANWGLDFVLNTEGIPIIVDLNMGRPNGNLAVRMWASRCPQRLSIYTSSWFVPLNGPKIQDITNALQSKDLLWNGTNGVMVYQHFVGCQCSYAVASSSGDSGLQGILSTLTALMLKRFSIDVNS